MVTWPLEEHNKNETTHFQKNPLYLSIVVKNIKKMAKIFCPPDLEIKISLKKSLLDPIIAMMKGIVNERNKLLIICMLVISTEYM